MVFQIYLPNCTYLQYSSINNQFRKEFSKIEIVKAYTQSTMTQGRQISLEIIIEHKIVANLDADTIIQTFTRAKAWKMNFS